MFVETIEKIEYRPTSQQGTGFLPPIVRGSLHVLFLMAAINDEKIEVSQEDAITELTAARDHFNSRMFVTSVSGVTLGKVDTLAMAIEEAITEYKDWDDKVRTKNLQDLSNRIVQVASDLDRELIGIRESDPGTQI